MFNFIPPGFFPFSPHVISSNKECSKTRSSEQVVDELKDFVHSVMDYTTGQLSFNFPDIVRRNYLLNYLKDFAYSLDGENNIENVENKLKALEQEMGELLNQDQHKQIHAWLNQLKEIGIQNNDDNPLPSWLAYFYYK